MSKAKWFSAAVFAIAMTPLVASAIGIPWKRCPDLTCPEIPDLSCPEIPAPICPDLPPPICPRPNCPDLPEVPAPVCPDLPEIPVPECPAPEIIVEPTEVTVDCPAAPVGDRWVYQYTIAAPEDASGSTRYSAFPYRPGDRILDFRGRCLDIIDVVHKTHRLLGDFNADLGFGIVDGGMLWAEDCRL